MPPTEAQLIVFCVFGQKSSNKFKGLLVVDVDKLIPFEKDVKEVVCTLMSVGCVLEDINSVVWLVVKSKLDVPDVASVVKKVSGDVDKLISFRVPVNEVIWVVSWLMLVDSSVLGINLEVNNVVVEVVVEVVLEIVVVVVVRAFLEIKIIYHKYPY